MVDGIPDNLWINGKVRVHQTIAHRPHKMPRYLRVCALHIVRNVARGFADNDEVQLNSPYRFGIILKRVKGHPLGEGGDFRDGIQHIPYALAP